MSEIFDIFTKSIPFFTLVVGISGAYAVSFYRTNIVENRIKDLEDWRNKHIEFAREAIVKDQEERSKFYVAMAVMEERHKEYIRRFEIIEQKLNTLVDRMFSSSENDRRKKLE